MLRFFPFGETFDASMGGRPLTADDPLCDIDLARYSGEVLLKRRLLTDMHGEYFCGGGETLAAQWEVLDLVLGNLAAAYPDNFILDKRGADWHWRNLLLDEERRFRYGDADSLLYEPLDWTGRQVQEDLVLVSPEDGHAFIGGQLCFANDWSLSSHIGRNFLEIHRPIPQTTMPSVHAGHRLLGSLKAGRTIWRMNWNFKHTEELDLSTRHQARYEALLAARIPHLTTHTIGHQLYLRVERQTLTRLASSMVVLFGIHTYISLLEDVAADPRRARRMFDVIRTTPGDVKDYKLITPIEPVLTAYLESRL